MHIADPATGNLGANAIVAGSTGIATGAAFSSKRLGTGQVAARYGNEPETVWADMVSGNFFSGLGVTMEQGRGFALEDQTQHRSSPSILATAVSSVTATSAPAYDHGSRVDRPNNIDSRKRLPRRHDARRAAHNCRIAWCRRAGRCRSIR